MGNLIKQEEGLPNITGNFSGNHDYTPNGSFRSLANYQSNSGTERYANIVEFSASRSSPIYGRSNHVTPENYTIRVWKRTA